MAPSNSWDNKLNLSAASKNYVNLEVRQLYFLKKSIDEIRSGYIEQGIDLFIAAVDGGLDKKKAAGFLLESIEESINKIERSESYLSIKSKNSGLYKKQIVQRKSKKPEFFSLWIGGPLSPFEWLCLKSYIDYGYDVTLYADREISAPKHVKLKRFQLLSPRSNISKYKSTNGTSITAFSDYFRYVGIKETGKIWIDTDNICLSDQIKPDSGYLFAPEDDAYHNIAVLGLPRNSEVLGQILQEVFHFPQKGEIPWGAIGPKLFTKILSGNNFALSKAKKREDFYPVHWKETASLFLPEMAAKIQMLVKNSLSIHIWNEVITRSGYFKDVAPPSGSFLSSKILEHGVASRFCAEYSSIAMRNLSRNMR